MIELPEAANLAKQFNEHVHGKKVARVIAAFSPHKFAWFHGDPANYHALLHGKTIGTAAAYGGLLEVSVDGTVLLFGDGVVLKLHTPEEKRPVKHQLLIEFEDETALTGSVQMYGGLWCFQQGEYENPYYQIARSRPSPLSNEFDQPYFDRLIGSAEGQKLSVKAFLATEQRIPGLGNGVLQDILYNARVHPKRKLATLTDGEKDAIFLSVGSTLKDMAGSGGRDVEKDLFGRPGGYQTRLSQKTVGKSCSLCGGMITRQHYMGGSIYFCDGCQKP